ncbi:MAG: hypothetical protein ACRD20_20480 [Terriglobales bacterium]
MNNIRFPEGVDISEQEAQRVEAALTALDKDPHAPREISIKLTLHVHNEFPKHVKVGEDADGNAITKIAANDKEEAALLAQRSA